jgi:hemerythrin
MMIPTLGDSHLDNCHQELAARMAALANAADRELVASLERLARLVTEHFAEEDADLKALGGDANQCHLDEHTAVLASIREVLSLVRAGSKHEVARRLGQELVEWLPRHVEEMDLRLTKALFMRRTGASPISIVREAVHQQAPR